MSPVEEQAYTLDCWAIAPALSPYFFEIFHWTQNELSSFIAAQQVPGILLSLSPTTGITVLNWAFYIDACHENLDLPVYSKHFIHGTISAVPVWTDGCMLPCRTEVLPFPPSLPPSFFFPLPLHLPTSFLLFLRQGVAMCSWLSWNLLCRTGWPRPLSRRYWE